MVTNNNLSEFNLINVCLILVIIYLAEYRMSKRVILNIKGVK